jgi:hypothetical protein
MISRKLWIDRDTIIREKYKNFDVSNEHRSDREPLIGLNEHFYCIYTGEYMYTQKDEVRTCLDYPTHARHFSNKIRT